MTVAVGAPSNNRNGVRCGHAHVFSFECGNWVQMGLNINGEDYGDDYGYAVSISSDGKTVAVGAPYNNNNTYNRGHVRVFSFVAGQWIKVGAAINGRDGCHENSGWAVSLSSDGKTVAVGAPYWNDSSTGHVRVLQTLS